MNSAPPANAPTPGFPVFWTMFGRIVAQMLGERAFAEIVVTLKDGNIQFVRVNRTYLPGNLPKV
jgi:hypothetical protein